MVGLVENALIEIRDKYRPDRIIIESSGSAFPATLALQIRQLEPEGFKLDGVVTVIDCVNFRGYEDTSPTAKARHHSYLGESATGCSEWMHVSQHRGGIEVGQTRRCPEQSSRRVAVLLEVPSGPLRADPTAPSEIHRPPTPIKIPPRD